MPIHKLKGAIHFYLGEISKNSKEETGARKHYYKSFE